MFEQMKTFVRIAEMGSITRAARSLGLSLPMASRNLRWLEQESALRSCTARHGSFT
jgi:DNA-binding transcriptional LysR family regulator